MTYRIKEVIASYVSYLGYNTITVNEYDNGEVVIIFEDGARGGEVKIKVAAEDLNITLDERFMKDDDRIPSDVKEFIRITEMFK